MNVPIAMICDDNYIAATGVALSSIISSKQSNTNYTIYMLCASLSAEHEAMFRSFESDSISIVILRVDANHFTSLVKGYETYTCPASPSALLKFELPNILDNEDKVLYLDVDIIVRTDLTELYLTPLENDLVGAVVDSSALWDRYYQRIDNYFNSGVMLLNLDLMRKENTMDALIESKLEQPTEHLMDQPAYNHVCHGRIKFLPLRYNLLGALLDRHHNQWTVDDINNFFDTSYACTDEIFDDAAIIHFAGHDKPWINPCVRFAKDWYNIYHDLSSCFHTISDYSTLLSKHITISLTSCPERINYVPEVISCLLSQTVREDQIILYLARDQFPELINSLPDKLHTFIDGESILVKWCDLDLKSHNKYFYAIQEYPDDVIITVDDDEYLPEDAIEELMLCWFKCPNAISARRTSLITFDRNNKVLPYHDWIDSYNAVLLTPSLQLVAVGYGGILYPPHILPPTTFDSDAIISTALYADDLWLKANEVLNDIPIALATSAIDRQKIIGSQGINIYESNYLDDNDIIFSNICDYFEIYYNTRSLIQNNLSRSSDFCDLIGQEPLIEYIKSLAVIANKASDLTNDLKEANAKRAEWYNKLHAMYKERDDLSAKLKEANAKRAEWYNTLQRTYKEKSELNMKLQATYAEKSERGVQIKAQQETIKELNERLDTIQNSWTYRIGRFFTWPVRKIRAIRSHSD